MFRSDEGSVELNFTLKFSKEVLFIFYFKKKKKQILAQNVKSLVLSNPQLYHSSKDEEENYLCKLFELLVLLF